MKNEEEREKNAEFHEILKVFSLAFKTQINLITDDSFKYNTSMKKIEGVLESLKTFSDKELNNLSNFKDIIEGNNEGQDIYNMELKNFINQLDFELLMNSLNKKFFLDCLKESLINMKFKWAYSTIDRILKATFYSINKFSKEEFKEVEIINNTFKNKLSTNISTDSKRIIRDERIKNNPLEAYHQVTDARAERTVVSGLDTWSSKQIGLTYGKLDLN